MIVIIGAGLIGLGIAYELARRGAVVRVVEARAPAAAASWAGAGMLAPYTEALSSPALETLCAQSLVAYPAFVEGLRANSTVDSHLRLDGVLQVAYDGLEEARLGAHVARLAARGVAARWLSRAEALEAEPALSARTRGAALLEGEGQVDNRRLGRALTAACAALGVEVAAGVGEVAIEANARRVLGIRTADGFFAARAVVNAAGAWAGALAGVPANVRVPVVPVKGQMLALAAPRALVRRVVWAPGIYLVPRTDGRLLLGATVEDAGFDVRVTARALRDLLAAGLAAMPALSDLAIGETWAGLRPGSPDGLPFLGATTLEGYFLATGHYRNGILLAPATARILADALEGKAPAPGDGAFAPTRTLEEGGGPAENGPQR
ncbi:MAG: glycine oxidase ThiO [Candidatus Baltobacteraceae bacterium]